MSERLDSAIRHKSARFTANIGSRVVVAPPRHATRQSGKPTGAGAAAHAHAGQARRALPWRALKYAALLTVRGSYGKSSVVGSARRCTCQNSSKTRPPPKAHAPSFADCTLNRRPNYANALSCFARLYTLIVFRVLLFMNVSYQVCV